jgi:hypothetical protein
MLPTAQMWQKTMTVSSQKTAELLSHGAQTITFLAPFLGRENTTKNAALEAGIKLNIMSYWVQRFYAAGILIQTKTEKRSGSPIHYYRAVADEFLVPTELISGASGEELMQRVQKHEYDVFTAYVVQNGLRISNRWNLHYYRNETGQYWTFRPSEIDSIQNLGQRPFHDWFHIEIDSAALNELRQDLAALRDKYNALDRKGESLKRVILHLGLVERN